MSIVSQLTIKLSEKWPSEIFQFWNTHFFSSGTLWIWSADQAKFANNKIKQKYIFGILIIFGDFINMKGTLQIITLSTELKLIKYIGHSEIWTIFQFWHTHFWLILTNQVHVTLVVVALVMVTTLQSKSI